MTDTTISSEPWTGVMVLTIGHSTRSLDELIDLIRAHGGTTIVDVRTVPRSRRNPQFNQDELVRALPAAGIAYHPLPRLGGLRHGLGTASPNTGWRNDSFRGFADYMQTEEFARGLDELRAIANDAVPVLMCAEAVPWRCHRSLIADALTVRGAQVFHIMSRTKADPHKLTPFAVVEGNTITYPVPADTAIGVPDV